MAEKESKVRPEDNLWKIALALVCGGILAYGFLYSDNRRTDLTYLVGRNLPMALCVWGLFYFVVARKCRGKVAGFSFVAIFISLIASGLIASSQNEREARQGLAEIHDLYSGMLDAATDSEGLPRRIDMRIDVTPKARGEFGEIERFLKECINQNISQRNDYLLDLEAIGWDSILDPGRIKADRTFVESRAMIQQAREISAKHRGRLDALLRNAREDILSLNVSESSKREMLSGFDEGLEEAKEGREAIWTLEENILQEVENIINLLSSARKWTVEDEQIVFYRDRDLDSFNSYLSGIDQMVEQQQAIQHQRTEVLRRKLDRMKERNE